ncbi:MAG TPA: nitroreductase family protein [Acidimicrobiia bacterium]|nr:nitroreductase family protein [Acidimicrobiia bacterium]
MEFEAVLKRRRMVRNYSPDPVPPETLHRIVRVARKAPSAGFSQGLAFVIVTEPAVRNAISELAKESSYVASGFDPWISRAPAHIVVCISEQAYHRRYQEPDKLDSEGGEIEWPVPYWWVDAGAALMLLLLATVNEGLAAGFLGTHALPDLRGLLDLPSEVIPIGVVTVGHPAPDRRSSSLQRGWKPEESAVHWQRWGGRVP